MMYVLKSVLPLMMLLESLFSGFQVIHLLRSCDLLLEPQAEA